MLEQIFIKQSLPGQCNYLFKSLFVAIATSMLNFLSFFINEEKQVFDAGLTNGEILLWFFIFSPESLGNFNRNVNQHQLIDSVSAC